MEPVGRRKGISITTTPSSEWHSVFDLDNWRNALPKAYVYRARAIAPDGNPVKLPRLGGQDEQATVYVGHTGPKLTSDRLYHLAKELVDRQNGHCGHGAGKRFWEFGVHLAIARICENFELQIGWDECHDYEGPASEDFRPDGEHPGSGTIKTSRKEIARQMERKLIVEYCDKYAELPPLNHQIGEFARDLDQLTGRHVDDDFESTH